MSNTFPEVAFVDVRSMISPCGTMMLGVLLNFMHCQRHQSFGNRFGKCWRLLKKKILPKYSLEVSCHFLSHLLEIISKLYINFSTISYFHISILACTLFEQSWNFLL